MRVAKSQALAQPPGGTLTSTPLYVKTLRRLLYVKTAAQEASLSCWRVRKSLMTR